MWGKREAKDGGPVFMKKLIIKKEKSDAFRAVFFGERDERRKKDKEKQRGGVLKSQRKLMINGVAGDNYGAYTKKGRRVVSRGECHYFFHDRRMSLFFFMTSFFKRPFEHQEVHCRNNFLL
jgi:hypothetical protein